MVTNPLQHSRLNRAIFACCLLAISLVSLLGGCAAQSGHIEQSLARLDQLEARVGTIDELKARVGTIEAQVELNASQGQQGLINIATMGPGIGGYVLALLLILVAWKLWRRSAYWKQATTQTIEIIEEQKGYTQGVRQQLAKAHARNTPFGKLVTATTARNRCSTSASNNSSSMHAA